MQMDSIERAFFEWKITRTSWGFVKRSSTCFPPEQPQALPKGNLARALEHLKHPVLPTSSSLSYPSFIPQLRNLKATPNSIPQPTRPPLNLPRLARPRPGARTSAPATRKTPSVCAPRRRRADSRGAFVPRPEALGSDPAALLASLEPRKEVIAQTRQNAPWRPSSGGSFCPSGQHLTLLVEHGQPVGG